MRLMFLVPFLFAFSSGILAQPETKQVILSGKKMEKRIVKKSFSNVPKRVTNYHARGALYFLIKVDATGNPSETVHLAGLKHIAEDVRIVVSKWKFLPLVIEGKPTPFRGVVEVKFWYGTFTEKWPD